MYYESYTITEIAPGIYNICEFDAVSMILIEGKDRCALLDTGVGLTDIKSVISQITDKPIVIINTHVHMDHIGGNGQFDEIYVGRYDEPFAHQSLKEREKGIIKRFFPKVAEADPSFESWDASSAPTIHSLKDGDVISLGNRNLEIYEIPGHTLGSIMILDREKRLAFTGDSILPGSSNVNLCNGAGSVLFVAAASLPVYLNSLKKIASFREHFDYLVSSHIKSGQDPFISPALLDTYIQGVEDIFAGKTDNLSDLPNYKNGILAKFESGGVMFFRNRMT